MVGTHTHTVGQLDRANGMQMRRQADLSGARVIFQGMDRDIWQAAAAVGDPVAILAHSKNRISVQPFRPVASRLSMCDFCLNAITVIYA